MATRPHRLGAFTAPLLLAVLALGGAAAGCAGDHAAGRDAAAPTAAAPPSSHDNAATHEPGTAQPGEGVPAPGNSLVPGNDPLVLDADAITAAWEARPAFVREAHEATQAAYAYALARPDVLRWLPCYCGCGGMGHGSNLDCFLVPRARAGDPVLFEEHGSYCDVCVETALMADRMLRDGSSLLQVRVAVDATFGGLAPGTPTELPPS